MAADVGCPCSKMIPAPSALLALLMLKLLDKERRGRINDFNFDEALGSPELWCPRNPSWRVTTSSRRRREVSGRLLFRSCRNGLREGYKLKPLFAQPGNEPIQSADLLTLVPVELPHVTVVENDNGACLNPPQHSRCYDFRARPGDIDREHVADHSAIPQLFDRVEGALGE
jgi:hypothetical protein